MATTIAGNSRRNPGTYTSSTVIATTPATSWEDALYKHVPTTELFVRATPENALITDPTFSMSMWIEALVGVTWTEVARANGSKGNHRDPRDGNLIFPSLSWSSTGWAQAVTSVRVGWTQNKTGRITLSFDEAERVYILDAHHSVAHDAASSAKSDSSNTLSWSHTVTGSDTLLIVGATHDDSGIDSTSATYNTVAMTSVASRQSSFWVEAEMYRLIAPTTGSNTVVINWDSATLVVGTANSFTGVDQTTPLGTAATAAGTNSAPSVAVSSATGELVVDVAVCDDNCTPGALTVGAGQTSRSNLHTDGACGHSQGVSTEAGAASVTMSWTFSVASMEWASIGVGIKPSGGGAATVVQDVIGAGVVPWSR